jgi:hypothetical protein
MKGLNEDDGLQPEDAILLASVTLYRYGVCTICLF